MELKRSKYFLPLAQLMATGENALQASQTLGISQSLAYKLSNSQEFRAEVSTIRTELLRDSMGKLANASTLAVETMVELMNCDNAPVRLRAAVGILERFSRISEDVDLRARVEKLEKAQKERGSK